MSDKNDLLSLLDPPKETTTTALTTIFSEDSESVAPPPPSSDATASPVPEENGKTSSPLVTDQADSASAAVPSAPPNHPTSHRRHAIRRPHRFLSALTDKEPPLLLLDRRTPAASLHIDVLIALLPLLLWAIYLYGWRPLTLTILAVGASIGFELLCRRLFQRTAPPDLTPVITGVILAFGLPPTAPLWLPILGALIAILPIRQLFGGTGRNRINPAVFALSALYMAFPSLMRAIPAARQSLSAFAFHVKDFEPAAKSTLSTLHDGFLPEASFGGMFFGLRAGTIGESAAFLLVGALLYLLWRRILRSSLPVMYLLTLAALAFAFPSLTAASDITALHGALYHILDGNTLFAAVFLLGDPVTTPKTSRGAILGGVIGGAVTFGMRLVANPAVSALAAVLVLNIMTPLLDRFLCPTPLGGHKKS